MSCESIKQDDIKDDNFYKEIVLNVKYSFSDRIEFLQETDVRFFFLGPSEEGMCDITKKATFPCEKKLLEDTQCFWRNWISKCTYKGLIFRKQN